MFIPHPVGFFSSGLTEVTMVASATNGDSTLTAPANIIAGDLLIVLDWALNTTATLPTTAIPSGFTSASNSSIAANAGANGTRLIASYKLADGSEASSNFTCMSATATVRNVMAVFRGNIPALSLTLASVAAQATDGNPTAQVVSSSGGVAPLVVFGCYAGPAGAGSLDPRTMSPAKDSELNFDNVMYLAWKIYNSAPADVTVDMDDEGGGNNLMSFYIQMAA